MTTWTVETVQALAKELLTDCDLPDSKRSRVVAHNAASALTWALGRIGTLERLDSEAATHVETLICTRTHFTGDPPYVGWKGLGLALKEHLDRIEAERDEAIKDVKLCIKTGMEVCAERDAANARADHAMAEATYDDIVAWADGIQGAAGTEYANRVSDMEYILAGAILAAHKEASK